MDMDVFRFPRIHIDTKKDPVVEIKDPDISCKESKRSGMFFLCLFQKVQDPGMNHPVVSCCLMLSPELLLSPPDQPGWSPLLSAPQRWGSESGPDTSS